MLIIEDGSGVANADSYISLADARTLAANYGIKLPDDDADAEVKLRQGYLLINTLESQLQGSRTHYDQTGAFPRIGVYSNCKEVASDSIPQCS